MLQAETHKNRGQFNLNSKFIETLKSFIDGCFGDLGSKVLLIPLTVIA
jgi:hypothetical protein